MNELIDPGTAETAATWVAALVTLVVLGGMLGERRAFGLAQHVLAGLATGYLALLAVREVLVPRVLEPLAAAPDLRLDAWLLLGLATATAAAPWLPRAVAAVPLSILVGSLAAFALGGAVIGTILPQTHATIVAAASPGAVAGGLIGLGITAIVLLGLVQQRPRARLWAITSGAGRWLLLGGLGGFLAYLLVSRLALLIDRLDFLIFDWLGLAR